MQQLCREAVGADLEGKSVIRRRHEPGGDERAHRQRDNQYAGDKLATALTHEALGHGLQDIAGRGPSLGEICAAVRGVWMLGAGRGPHLGMELLSARVQMLHAKTL
jgi:hypothetical protein